VRETNNIIPLSGTTSSDPAGGIGSRTVYVAWYAPRLALPRARTNVLETWKPCSLPAWRCGRVARFERAPTVIARPLGLLMEEGTRSDDCSSCRDRHQLLNERRGKSV